MTAPARGMRAPIRDDSGRARTAPVSGQRAHRRDDSARGSGATIDAATHLRPRRGFTDRGRALLAAGVTLALSGMALGFVDLTRVGLLLLGLPLLTIFAYQVARPKLNVERRLRPATATVGQGVRVDVRVVNDSAYPSLTARAEEQLPTGLGDQARFVLPSVPRRGSRTVHYTVPATRRGRHRLGPLGLQVSDPFGLTTSLTPVPGTTELLVLPAVARLAGRAGLVGGSGSSGSETLAPGATGVDDASLREYQAGDDLRRIHWPVTAHRGELMVRHDGRAPVREAALCLDPGLPVTASGEAPALEWAVHAMASIAAHLAAQGYALTLTTPGRVAAARYGETLDLDETLMALAVVDPYEGRLIRPHRQVRGRPAAAPRAGAAGATGATESPLVTATRDNAVGSGLVVLIAGTHNPQAAHDLLGTLAASTAGIAFLVDHSGFTRTGRRLDPARPAPAGAAHELAAFAASGGWRTHLVSGPEPIDLAWERVSAGRTT